MSFRTFLVLAFCAASAVPAFARPHPHRPAPAAQERAGRPGDRVYTLIEQHNPGKFLQAARSAEDTLKNGGREAQIMLAGRGILMVVPNFTNVQRDIAAIQNRSRGLRIIACKETVDMLARSNHNRQPPMMRGVSVEYCKDRVRKLQSAGWQPMLGI
jgi:hypothetical protein